MIKWKVNAHGVWFTDTYQIEFMTGKPKVYFPTIIVPGGGKFYLDTEGCLCPNPQPFKTLKEAKASCEKRQS